MTTLMTPAQAAALALAVQQLDPPLQEDMIHVTAVNDGSGCIKVEVTSSLDMGRWISRNGNVLSYDEYKEYQNAPF